MPVADGYVLVIDDDPAIREVIAAVLETEGYCVRTAADGPRGLALTDVERPVLVLLDVHMPGMSGWEVLAALVQRPRDRPPVVVMTAAGDTPEWALQMGADGYLPKPFDLDRLLGIVRRWVADNR